jgi:hypothetical protein
MVIYVIDDYGDVTLFSAGKRMIFGGAMTIDPVLSGDAIARLEQLLQRVELATAGLRQEQQRVQARYELLDHTASEVLTAIDALMADADKSHQQPKPSGQPQAAKLAVADLADTADAA